MTDIASLPPIPRSTLIELTEETIERIRRTYSFGVPEVEAEAYRQIAREADTISQFWYDSNHDCGCLVGHLLQLDHDPDYQEILKLPKSQREVGYEFGQLLDHWARAQEGTEFRFLRSHPGTCRVVD